MKRLILALLASATAGTALAQWTVRQSDFKGSPLEQIYQASPYLVHVMPDDEWNSSNFADMDDMKWFEDARYGMYIHFGLATYKNRDLSWGMADGVAPDMSQGAYPRSEWSSWPQKLYLEKFSKEEFTDILRRSGMKYVVIVAKHHDGFHFYDTKYSDFKVTNTPYGKDLVREILDAARAAQVKVGIYFSQRDWYHPDYAPLDTATIERISEAPYFKARPGKTVRQGDTHRKYIEYMFNTVRELCTNYGKLDMFNFDASYWDGMFTADMWDAERLTRMIRQLQPGIIINNRASLPGDYDSPEQRIGMYQDRRMWETCMSLCDTWSYSPSRVKTPQEVFRNIQSVAVGNGNMLLSWGMKWDGEWDEVQKQSLIETGKLLDTYGESIYRTHGGPWMPGDWGGSTYLGDKVYLHIFNATDSTISLPKLKDIVLKYDKVLTGQAVNFTDKGDKYELDCRISDGQMPLILELTSSRPIVPTDIIRNRHSGDLFDNGRTYGQLIISHPIGANGDTEIDLGRAYTLKGVQLNCDSDNPMCRVRIQFSGDGQNWNTYRMVNMTGRQTVIPVATYIAGILAEGVATRHIRLQPEGDTPDGMSCRIYGDRE